MKRIIGLMLIVVMITACLTGCGKKEQEECEIVLDEFEYACNELDLDAILRCINPEVSDPIRIGLAFVTNWTYMDTEDMVDKVATALTGTLDEINLDTTELFQSMELETKEFAAENGRAAVLSEITFETMGVEMEKYVIFDLIQLDEKWYIDGFEFVDYTE